MTTVVRVTLLAVALGGLASPARAQLGEVQVGTIVSYGPGRSAGPTPGLVLGLAGARLVYIGARATRYSESRTDGATTARVTDHATALAFDLAVVIPSGPLEVMLGASTGAVRHSQRVVQGATTTDARSTRSFVAPSLSAEIHAGPLALIPEIQYQFSGRPDLAYPVRHSGWLVSLRLVAQWEVGRIRT